MINHGRFSREMPFNGDKFGGLDEKIDKVLNNFWHGWSNCGVYKRFHR